MTELAPPLPARPALSASAPPLARAFYIAEVALMSVLVLAGFWPFYADLPSGAVARHPVMYVHGAVFTGWLFLLFAQVILIYRRKVKVHQRLGRYVAAYALLVLLLGTAVTIIAPVEHVKAGRWTLDAAAGFLVLPIGDLLLFGGLFTAGMISRRVPMEHKRWMLLASNALIFPGVARLTEPAVAAMLALWFLPVILAMVFDRATIGRVHRVYWIGAAAMLIAFTRVALIESEAWLRIGRPLVQAFL
ncbi:MAG: hypothetical protein M3Q55_14585 [Acidobacteriota bacterium]|nr:hypothetical protein [Acidobacteriota bacterium]